jgi:hypothetical protein
MPAKQRPRCDDKGPACTRQDPAGSREEEPVAPRQRRTAGSSPENGEFVPKHDDFQLLEIVRPKAPGSKLQNPPKHQITEGDEHEVSSVVRRPTYSTHSLPDSFPREPENALRTYAPFTLPRVPAAASATEYHCEGRTQCR